MRLLPLGVVTPSDWKDGLWVEKPGFPGVDASWIHPPPRGQRVPEFEFEEGHARNRNEPGPEFIVGVGSDCHVRVEGSDLQDRACRIRREGRQWLLEALLPNRAVHLNGEALEIARRVMLKNGDVMSLLPPPTPFAFRLELDAAAALDDQPNRFPARFPYRSSFPETPVVPDELRRLAWQTDQMRRRSEEDQAFRPSDWASFSQYVKRHYYKHGIECVSWAEEGTSRPIDQPPPMRPPRPFPAWIAEVVSTQRHVPGVDCRRELPFASCLGMSSPRDLAEDCNVFSVGPHPVSIGDPGASASHVRRSDEAAVGMANGDAVTNIATQMLENRSTSASAMVATSLPIADWLSDVDDELYLLREYHDRIVSRFDSLEQIFGSYFKEGVLDHAFFEDMCIKKLGHRRMFEKWFRDTNNRRK